MLDLGPTGPYPHTFLVADDSYAPAFTEIIGDTVAEAMADDNKVYEHPAGEMVTKTFDIKSVSLADAQQMEITGIHELPYSEKIEWAPNDSNNDDVIPMYHGLILSKTNSGTREIAHYSRSSVAEAIENELDFSMLMGTMQWYPIANVRKMGAVISDSECITVGSFPLNQEMEFVDIPIFTNVTP